jgi:hypothetical protein
MRESSYAWHNIVEYGVESDPTKSADVKTASERVRNAREPEVRTKERGTMPT